MSFPPLERRSFLGRVSALLGGLGAGAALPSLVGAQSGAQSGAPVAPPRDVPRHARDQWFDQLPGAHRLILDAVTPFGAVEAAMFGWNFLRTSGTPYGLKDADHAVVITLRHDATVMALTQAMWDKYAPLVPKPFDNPLGEGQAQKSILRTGTAGGAAEPFTWDGLAKRGIHFAICGAAMTRLSGQAAGKGGDAKVAYADLEASLPPNSHIMPSGITAVQRAQEYGYSYAHTG
jgi:intracellular sulfur oxidation DsrE/DsrF family protein